MEKPTKIVHVHRFVLDFRKGFCHSTIIIFLSPECYLTLTLFSVPMRGRVCTFGSGRQHHFPFPFPFLLCSILVIRDSLNLFVEPIRRTSQLPALCIQHSALRIMRCPFAPVICHLSSVQVWCAHTTHTAAEPDFFRFSSIFFSFFFFIFSSFLFKKNRYIQGEDSGLFICLLKPSLSLSPFPRRRVGSGRVELS